VYLQALGVQHAMRMHYVLLWPAPLYSTLPHYLINGTIFEKKSFLKPKHVFRVSLQLLSEIFFISRRTERGMIKNVHWSSCLQLVQHRNVCI